MLPIEPHLPEILRAIDDGPAILLQASPGSGKTTLVPLALMQHFKGKVLVLEPRRIATRWAAQRVAELAKTKLGEKVGYQYRFEKKLTSDTQLVFLTEGTFLRYLQTNPTLAGVDAVVLDEFHERHLTTDMAFGLFHELAKKWTKIPKLVIMSATLDEAPLRKFYPTLKKIDIVAPVFPLETIYSPTDVEWSKRPLERKVMWGIQEGWKHPGDMLVFLPGLGEIKRVETLLQERLGDFPARILKLHGQEASSEADILGASTDKKIILASNVAESSVTIPGVRVVVDAGLTREAVFSPWNGHTELLTKASSKASAIQRAGRAARTASGVAIRLYTQHDFEARTPFSTPELHNTDLADVVLELGLWGLKSREFAWPENPDDKKLTHAEELLAKLQAMNSDGITAIGKKMSEAPLPVRVARVWHEALTQGTPAAFQEICHKISQWLERGSESRKLFERIAHNKAQGTEINSDHFWLAGFPDRIAKARPEDVITVTGDTFKLSPEVKNIWDNKRNYWLVLDINGLSKTVTRLIPLEDAWVKERAETITETLFDEKRSKMIKRTSLRLGQITLETKDEVVEGEAAGRGPLEKAAREWLADFKQSKTFVRWSLFQSTLYPDKDLQDFEWELFLEEFLLDERLPDDKVAREFLQRLQEELQLYFDATFTHKVNDVCPTHFKLHDKRSCEIQYPMGQPPWIEAYIQDFFGRSTHPALMNGKIPLTIHLWGPHGRALQVTGDLPGFWQRHYPSLKKELSRDYPRHFWPDTPATAEPMLRLPRKS